MSYRLTAIALAILVVLGVGVWFSEFRDQSSASATANQDKKTQIFSFDDSSTKGLEVVKGDQKVGATKDDQGNWTLQPSGQPGDRVRLSSLLTRLSNLTANRTIAEDATDLSPYGLDNPSLTATVTQQDGTVYVLQAGNKAPTETGTYVKKGDSSTVYLITTQLVTDLDRMVTDPPIQLPTPTPAPIPSPSPTPSPSPAATPTG